MGTSRGFALRRGRSTYRATFFIIESKCAEIGQKSAGAWERGVRAHGGHTIGKCEVEDPLPIAEDERLRNQRDGIGRLAVQRSELALAGDDPELLVAPPAWRAGTDARGI